MFDIVAVGEILIDFTPNGNTELGYPLFVCNPGGAPANVLAAAGKFGRKTAFIGKVGSDLFGDFLRAELENAGISVLNLATCTKVHTTLAFVQLDTNGDRTFSFYRDPGADTMLEKEDIDADIIKSCKILHFGSVSLTDDPSRSATLYAVKLAKEAGCLISYDPNYRPLLWKNSEGSKNEMISALKMADIIKVSEEEMNLLTGESDLERGAASLAKYGAVLVLVSLGRRGAFYSKGNMNGILPAYDVKTIDTTGAGDAFIGAVLHRICEMSRTDIQMLTKEQLEEIISFANGCGSLATTKKGAIPAMPSLNEIENCRKEVPLLLL